MNNIAQLVQAYAQANNIFFLLVAAMRHVAQMQVLEDGDDENASHDEWAQFAFTRQTFFVLKFSVDAFNSLYFNKIKNLSNLNNIKRTRVVVTTN